MAESTNTMAPPTGATHSRRAVVRGALAAGAAVTLAAPAGAVPAPDPDAELLALVTAAVRDHVASVRGEAPEHPDDSDRWYDEVVFPRTDRICELRARSARGLAAKLLKHIHDQHLQLTEEIIGGPASLAHRSDVRDLVGIMEDALALAATLGEPPVPGGLFHG